MPQILAETFSGYDFLSVAPTLYIYARDNFIASSGEPVVEGKFPNQNWRKKVICSVGGGILSVPAFDLEPTTNSDYPIAQYEAFLVDSDNQRQNFFVKRFSLPPGTGGNITWNQIRQFNELPLIIESLGATTDNLPEGLTNLYFTNARAEAALSGAFQPINQKGVASGYAPLGIDSKIPSQFLPTFTVNSVVVVANQAARLALSLSVIGDAAKQTDTGETFMLAALPASNNANWVPISDISPDWSAVINKPTFGTASLLNAPVSGNAGAGEVVKGDDTRLGSPEWLEIQNKPTFGTASLLDVPETGNASATQVMKGSDTRLLPAGGTAHQILEKVNNTNFNVAWVDAPIGGGGAGGTVPFLNDTDTPDNIDLVADAIPFENDAAAADNIPLGGFTAPSVDSVNGADGAVMLGADDIPEGLINKYNQTHTGDVTGSSALTIANNAVTSPKILDNAVTTSKIADNAIATAKIPDNAITNAKVASIVATKITEDSTHRFATDAEKIAWNAKHTEAITALRNGVATPGDDLNKLYNLILTHNSIIGGTTADGDSLVNTVAELLAVFATYPEATDIATLMASKLAKSSNLSDLTNAANARSNLGLAALAVLATVGTGQIDNDAVTYTKIQNVTADRLLGRSTAGAGDIEEIVCTAVGRAILAAADAAAQRTALGLGALALLATVDSAQIATNAIVTAKIADANVTTPKIADANVTTAKIANNAITPAKRAALAVLTDGATVPIDASLSEKFRLTSSGSRTIGIPSNPIDGQSITIIFKNSAGTSQTLSLTTGSAGAFAFTDAVTGLTATPAGKTDFITATYDAGATRWFVLGYAKES